MTTIREFRYFTAIGLIFAVSVFSACGSRSLSNGNSSSSTVNTSRNVNAEAVETKNTDMSPITMDIANLFAESDAGSASTMRQKYGDRQMTVTGGVLYEFKVDMLRVGKGQNPEFGVNGTTPQYFVTCKGTFNNDSGREETRTVINLKLGKAEPINVKGLFKEASSYNNKHWVILDECARVKS